MRRFVRKHHPLFPRHFSCPTLFFPHRIGVFTVVVGAGQLFRYAGQHSMCVAWQYMHLERELGHMGPNSIAFGKSTSQRIYPKQHTPQIG